MKLGTYIRRIVIAVGWCAFFVYSLFSTCEENWRLWFSMASFVLFVQSFMRIGEDE